MAIDSTLWMVDITAGDYAVGDILEFKLKDGPANVRSGRGPAILKSIVVGSCTSTAPEFRVHIKNSNWIDEVVSNAANATSETAFSKDSGNVQRGADEVLQSNSSWEIYAECVVAGTSTGKNTLFALIDVDYPSVSSVVNPAMISGTPVSIVADRNINTAAYGTSDSLNWNTLSMDYFKAGFVYCLENVEVTAASQMIVFVKMSNAAGMGGLSRIVPANTRTFSIRYPITYSSRLVKGPMDVSVMALADSAAAVHLIMSHDYVKRASA